MRTLKFAAACVFVLAMATEVSAQDFKVYPGATKFAYSAAEDTKKAIVSTSSGTTQTIYVSDDSFDKVATFYRGIAREYTMPYQQNDKNARCTTHSDGTQWSYSMNLFHRRRYGATIGSASS